MRTFTLISILIAACVCVTVVAVAQTTNTLICSTCKEPNRVENNFCTSCGEQLTDEKTELQEEEKPFTFREPSRLFSVPTASVIPELAVGFTVGNSFGQQEEQSFLGNMSAGIGGIAELELNTGGVVGNIVAGVTRMSTWGMKVQLYGGDGRLPAAAVAVRSSNDWDKEGFGSDALQTSNEPQFREGLRGVNYDMRITTASLTLSRKIHERTTVHGALGYSDIRHRNLGVQRVDSGFFYDNSEKRSTQWQLAGGFAMDVNPRTKVIAELQTIPFFNVNLSNNALVLERMYVGAMGVRFALSRAFTLDSGVRYQSNFVGLADTQVRVALNCIFLIPL